MAKVVGVAEFVDEWQWRLAEAAVEVYRIRKRSTKEMNTATASPSHQYLLLLAKFNYPNASFLKFSDILPSLFRTLYDPRKL
uniref:Uncharacterized protein n=1 Tax=Salix viminalis TaxID=40686 RepID=A0A6N2MA42_SALVM